MELYAWIGSFLVFRYCIIKRSVENESLLVTIIKTWLKYKKTLSIWDQLTNSQFEGDLILGKKQDQKQWFEFTKGDSRTAKSDERFI